MRDITLRGRVVKINSNRFFVDLEKDFADSASEEIRGESACADAAKNAAAAVNTFSESNRGVSRAESEFALSVSVQCGDVAPRDVLCCGDTVKLSRETEESGAVRGKTAAKTNAADSLLLCRRKEAVAANEREEKNPPQSSLNGEQELLSYNGVKETSEKIAAFAEDGGIVECVARKNLRGQKLMVGDVVCVEKSGADAVIVAVEKRKNRLIRPYIANVDAIVLVVAPLPTADLLLVDKMILNARHCGLEIILCINKSDIDGDNIFDAFRKQYGACVDAIVCVSAVKRDLHSLRRVIAGKTCCLAGQSAVGKSSIINAVIGCQREVGELSSKILRGKNTTTMAEIFKIDADTFIADTPGFSLLDVWAASAEDLPLLYDDFVVHASHCRFSGCTHTSEPNCGVREAVERGEIDGGRYVRYKQILEEVKRNGSYAKRSYKK